MITLTLTLTLNPKPSLITDICDTIATKQSQYNVWFLSGCGLYEHVDPRRTSIAAALAFARDRSLAGVVLPAEVGHNYLLESLSIQHSCCAPPN